MLMGRTAEEDMTGITEMGLMKFLRPLLAGLRHGLHAEVKDLPRQPTSKV